MKTKIILVVSLCGLLGSGMLQAQAPATNTAIQTDTAPVIDTTRAPALTDTASIPGLGDPFNYLGDDLGGYNTDETPIVIPEILIRAIIVSEKNSQATIEMNQKTIYLKTGDLLRIPGPQHNPIYLQVIHIGDDQIEFAPQERPERRIIIK